MKSYKNARAYIFWGNVWRHVYIYRSYEQEQPHTIIMRLMGQKV